jgi:hypothetical protein
MNGHRDSSSEGAVHDRHTRGPISDVKVRVIRKLVDVRDSAGDVDTGDGRIKLDDGYGDEEHEARCRIDPMIALLDRGGTLVMGLAGREEWRGREDFLVRCRPEIGALWWPYDIGWRLRTRTR